MSSSVDHKKPAPPPQAAPPQAAPTGDAAPPGPPKWVAVALNLLPRGKLSVTAVKIQVLHAAERDGTPLSAAVWLDVLEVCEERGIDGKRVMELQEALDIDMAAFEPRTPDES